MRLKKKVKKIEDVFNERIKILEETDKTLQEQINIISELIEPLILKKAEKEIKEATNNLCLALKEMFETESCERRGRPKSKFKKTQQVEIKEKRGRGRPRKETK